MFALVTPLKKAREKRALTTYDVARALDVSQPHYNRIENAEVGASKELAAKLAVFFGHEVTEMQILYPERYTPTPEPAIQKAS